MPQEQFELSGEVELFPGAGGWYFVRIPRKYTDLTKPLAKRGLVAITAKIGKFTWSTSLMPMGDGTQFIPLPRDVRSSENITISDHVELSFTLREW